MEGAQNLETRSSSCSSSSSSSSSYVDKQQQRVEDIKAFHAHRIGYPGTGSLQGYFEGGRFVRTDSSGLRPSSSKGKPLVDLSHLGVSPQSLACTLINNAGPMDSTITPRDVRESERDCLRMLSSFLGILPTQYSGYMTNGSTEGVFFMTKQAKEFCRSHELTEERRNGFVSEIQTLGKSIEDEKSRENWKKAFEELEQLKEVQKKLREVREPILVLSDRVHYGWPKVASYLELDSIRVKSQTSGEIDLQDFNHTIQEHMKTGSHRPLICVATLGTTQEGAIDDVEQMKEILKREVDSKRGVSCVLLDAAIGGGVVPFLKKFTGKNLFEFGDAIVVSTYKLLYTFMIASVVLVSNKLKSSPGTNIPFLKIRDETVSGSRAGLPILEFQSVLYQLEMDKIVEGLERDDQPAKLRLLFETSQENMKYFFDRLCSVLGQHNVFYKHTHLALHFRLELSEVECQKLTDKWGLMRAYVHSLPGQQSFVVHTRANVDKWLIDSFIEELQLLVQNSSASS